MHVHKDFAERAVSVVSGAQVELVSADDRLLRVALAAVRQAAALGEVAVDDFFRNSHLRRLRGQQVLVLQIVPQLIRQSGVERLAELGAVAVERVALERKLPRHQVSLLDVRNVGVARQVDRLRDGSGNERLGRRHHADVRLRSDVALSALAALVGAVEHRVVLRLEVRSALNGHGTTNRIVRSLDFLVAEAEVLEQAELIIAQLILVEPQSVLAELVAQRPAIEDEGDVECSRKLRFHVGQRLVREALLAQDFGVDARSALERAAPLDVVNDVLHLGLFVTEPAQGGRNGLVDDLEVAASGELFELHEREVRLDPGGVAVHQQADGPGRRDHRDLRVAEAVLFPQLEGTVGILLRGFQQVRRAVLAVNAHRLHQQAFVLAVRHPEGGAAVVAQDAEHGFAVALVAGKRAEFLGHLRRGRVGGHVHDGRDRPANGQCLWRVVGNAVDHQVGAEVGVAQAERAELVGEFGDALAGELRHQYADFQHNRPQPGAVAEFFDVQIPACRIPELEQVQRRQIAGRIVKKHVLTARVRGADGAVGRAGVPLVDGAVELHPRIGGGPCGVGDLLPKLLRPQHFAGLRVTLSVGGFHLLRPPVERPVSVRLHGLHELVAHADGVVGVLPGNGLVGFGIPVGVVLVKGDAGVALLGKVDDALDVAEGHL